MLSALPDRFSPIRKHDCVPTYVWFGWDGEYLRFSQTTNRQKYRNLRRAPRVAISLVDANDPYRYLEIRGVVERIEPDPDKAFINRMAKKYLGQDTNPWNQPDEERVVIVVRPERTTRMG